LWAEEIACSGEANGCGFIAGHHRYPACLVDVFF
jgi:hypothetical protein